MSRLWIGKNPLVPSEWTCDSFNGNPIDELMKHYGESLPSNVRIYHNSVSIETDVTPTNLAEIEKLKSLTGEFYAVHYPEGGALAIIAIVVAVVAVTAAFFMKPSIPVISQKNQSARAGSSNNSLSERTNDVRVGGRVPYIVGRVKSYPDMIALPYKTLVGGQEVEHAVFAIGQGEYDILAAFDDETRFDEISGNSLMAFKPNTNVVDSKNAYYVSGSRFQENIYIAKASKSATGQTLIPINNGDYRGNNNITFKYPDTIICSANVTFEDYFYENDVLTITNSSQTITITEDVITEEKDPTTGEVTGTTVTQVKKDVQVSFDGTYNLLSVSGSKLILSNPSASNSDWDLLAQTDNGESKAVSAQLATGSVKWVGPFDLTMKNRNRVVINIRAPQGMFRVNTDGNQIKEVVNFEIEITRLDDAGNPTSTVELIKGSVSGSSVSRDATGVTVDHETSWVGPCRIRVRRTSKTQTQKKDQYQDTIKFSELYAVEELKEWNYGDVTVVRTKTFATASALSVKDRKVNLDVIRLLPHITSANKHLPQSYTELFPTQKASDILIAVALEPTIGNRSIDELDLDSIHGAIDDNYDYFGFEEAGHFCYTFDDANISFEETVTAIAESVFCKAYRRGNQLKLYLEKETEDSVLLFNHRNKVPDSERRTTTFGYFNEFDGVTLDWNNPDNFDATETLYLPEDQSAINPKKLDFIGVRNIKQAKLLAWRIWQKLKYQNITAEFTATDEANILLLNERVLNSDNTRKPVLEGEIENVQGLELFASQKTDLDIKGRYTAFIQLKDGTVQSIPCFKGSTDSSFILKYPPRLSLVYDDAYYAKTTYQIVSNEDVQKRAFLVDQLNPNNDYTVDVVLKNYDSRFYSHDKDYDMRIFVPVGSIVLWPGEQVPEGSFPCTAYKFDRTKNPELYKILGTDVTPDMRGLMVEGYDDRKSGTIGAILEQSSHDHFTGAFVGTSGSVSDDIALFKATVPFSGTPAIAQTSTGDLQKSLTYTVPTQTQGPITSTKGDIIGEVKPKRIIMQYIIVGDGSIPTGN